MQKPLVFGGAGHLTSVLSFKIHLQRSIPTFKDGATGWFWSPEDVASGLTRICLKRSTVRPKATRNWQTLVSPSWRNAVETSYSQKRQRNHRKCFYFLFISQVVHSTTPMEVGSNWIDLKHSSYASDLEV